MKLIGNSNICPTLTSAERAVIAIIQEPMIKDLSKSEASNGVQKAIIQGCTAILAIKQLKDISEIDKDFIIDYVTKVVLDRFTSFRLSELTQACELWATGALFSDRDLNLLSVENMLRAFVRYKELVYREAIHKQTKHQEKLEKELEQKQHEEKVKALEKEICEVYNQYCESFIIPDLPLGLKAAYCRHLYAKAKVDFTALQEKEIFDIAEKLLPHEEEVKKMNDVDRAFKKKKKQAELQEIAESVALEYLFQEYQKKNIDINS